MLDFLNTIVLRALIVGVLIGACVFPCAGGDASEHRRVGDAAFITALESDSTLRSMFAENGITGIVAIVDGAGGRDVVLTYGMVSEILCNPSTQPLDVLRSLQRAALTWKSDRLVVDSWLLGKLRSLDSIPPTELWSETRSHRVTPGTSYEQQLHVIDELLARTFLPSVRDRDEHTRPHGVNADTLSWELPSVLQENLTAPAVYVLLHARARALAMHGLSQRRPQERMRFVLLAVLTSAVADHYMQDLFASEHHIADCMPPAQSMLLNEPEKMSMEEHSCHEFYRRVGIPFPFAHAPLSQILYGSGHFSEEQIARATQATATSVSDVFAAPVLYYDFVDEFIDVVRKKPSIADSYAHPVTHCPLPLLPAIYEDVRPLHRSIVGPYVQAGANVLTTGRTVGYSLEAVAGMVLNLSPENMPRSRFAGYETELCFVPAITATYGFARDAWFALLRGSLSLQLFDNVRAGVSAGPSFSAAGTTVPVFIDAAFISKPLSYHLGMEFNISVSLTQQAPYDVRVGVAYALY